MKKLLSILLFVALFIGCNTSPKTTIAYDNMITDDVANVMFEVEYENYQDEPVYYWWTIEGKEYLSLKPTYLHHFNQPGDYSVKLVVLESNTFLLDSASTQINIEL